MKRKSDGNPDLDPKRRMHDRREQDTDAWFQLHCSSTQFLAVGNYDAAIDSSLRALEQLDNFKTMILDTCAAAYALKGEFSKGMEAAEKMIECVPTAAAGYLRSGDTLALQGKHKHAIQMYNEGIEKVAIGDDQHASLEEHRTASQVQLNKRVDFLTLLPVDIVHIIIDQLDIVQQNDVACMEVSKGWRQMFVDYELAWRNLMCKSNTFFRFIPSIGKHVRNLQLWDCNSDGSQVILEAVVGGELCNVRQLTVTNIGISGSQLLILLARLGSTLTDLKVVMDDYKDHAPTLESILLACPKLESLCYHINGGDMDFSERATSVIKERSIRSLDLEAKLITIDALEMTLRRCPQLHFIQVKSCTADALKLINDYCPHIKTIGFNGPAPVRFSTFMDNSPGMQALAIHVTGQLEPENVIRLLTKGQSTLRAANLGLLDNMPDVLERWDGLGKVKCENLRHLTYAYGHSMDMHTIVATMIPNCKALESVMLQGLKDLSGNALEQALLALPKLETLVLFDVEEVNVANFERFFSTHAGKGAASSLQKICFVKCKEVYEEIFETVAAISTLEEVEIEECKDLPTTVLETFISHLGSTNVVKGLTFAKMDSVTDTVLYDLATVSSLRKITLKDLPKISSEGAQELAYRMNDLESFNILRCAQIGWHTTNNIARELRVKWSC